MTIDDPWLRDRLVCPLTRVPLRRDPATGELVSEAAGLAYPVRNGVPVLIVEEARAIR
ncbi:Trm112 family protein [Sphingomonas sp.]|uniref:Trm112 family protein n=1 Tax=Sphingomonas sp. TaxID=28214 RepID=UPI002B9C6CE1|nr:Trm112 family protein [Sphingomonas sp.]HWK37203.1 Trm112 family protein [Sphingomonas sp.]